jgi:hypothetical protein
MSVVSLRERAAARTRIVPGARVSDTTRPDPPFFLRPQKAGSGRGVPSRGAWGSNPICEATRYMHRHRRR